MRKAGKKLLERPFIHDLGETMATAGALTVPQLLTMNELDDPNHIAVAAGAGIGTALLARPIGRSGGRALGRAIDRMRKDKVYPADLEGYVTALGEDVIKGGISKFMAEKYHSLGMNLLWSSRQSGAGARLRQMTKYETVPEALKPIVKATDPIRIMRSDAYNTVDGRKLTGMEADLGLLTFAFGDNLAQALVQMAIASELQKEPKQD